MIGRTNILASLRRRRAGLGRLVLAWFAAGSFTASASPCLAMAVSAVQARPAPVAEQDAAPRHAHAHGGHATVAPAGATFVSQHHSHSGSHADAQHQAADAASQNSTTDPSRHASGHCPHCPVPASGSAHPAKGAHAFCSTLDDGSGNGPSSAQQPSSLKYVSIQAPYELAPPPLLRAHESRPVRTDRRVHRTVALNVRNCVFLI